jgi:glycosyltransferase A (GT-A) superfamily protein (DUF2064 family)
LYFVTQNHSIQEPLTTPTTAILVFARGARLDARDKGLAGSERFLSQLTSQTLQTARRTGFPCFHFDENSQTGDTFGRRLGNAMQAVFDQGVTHLLVIGNDSPELRSGDLVKAADFVKAGKTVFGPSADGGTYMIGISRESFDLNTFIDLPWQLNHLLGELIRWNSSRGGSCELLKPLLDLDTRADCRNWFAPSRFLASGLHQWVLTFLSLKKIVIRTLDIGVLTLPCATPFNKGSPF